MQNNNNNNNNKTTTDECEWNAHRFESETYTTHQAFIVIELITHSMHTK
jgi:hypothetical protein